MPTEADPMLQQWYQHLDKGQKFRVVAVDEASGLIEIQYFDGDLEEIDRDTWYELDIELIEPPEDWTGPMDDIERDDLGYSETDMESEDWSAPLRELRRKTENWQEPEERDDWGEGLPEEEPGEGEE